MLVLLLRSEKPCSWLVVSCIMLLSDDEHENECIDGAIASTKSEYVSRKMG
jgi:hypothetical protein